MSLLSVADTETIDAIRARWSTCHDRGAHDYTDAGCRVLAEHAFRDIAALLTILASVSVGCGETPPARETVARVLALTRYAYGLPEPPPSLGHMVRRARGRLDRNQSKSGYAAPATELARYVLVLNDALALLASVAAPTGGTK